MIRTTTRAALALGAALTLAACSGDATGGNQPLPAGTFEANITGDYAATAKGTASSPGMEMPQAQWAMLELRDERDSANATLLQINFPHHPVPAGTYVISPALGDTSVIRASFWRYNIRQDDEIDYAVLHAGGALTIESVSGNTVRGTVNLQQTAQGGGTHNFSYVGRFTATYTGQ